MQYAVITFGCRVNQSDSLRAEEDLLALGATPGPAESADVVVVNTCSVTASADQGARQTIRRIARLNPSARIVVTGCYATREREAVADLPNVSAVVPNEAKPVLIPLLRAGLATELPTPVGDGPCGAAIEPGVAGRTAFTLRVQNGCAEPCSYCIIPTTRGVPSSVSVEAILADVERVSAAGFREVALTGVHLGSYGRDRADGSSLAGLLCALRDRFAARADDGGPSMVFRVSSLEPMDCTDEVVAVIRDADCFAPHFHLPLQHASSRMLAAMRRPYDAAYYDRLVRTIRRDIPHASIGTDLIVGFPGESDADFDELAAYLERSPLTHLHVFPYSDRPGTDASRMGDRPAGLVVKARGTRVRQIGAVLARRFLASQVGAVHRALTLEDGTLAVTGNYLKVRIPPGQPRNQWVHVAIDRAEPDVRGRLVQVAAPRPTATGALSAG